MGLYDDVVEVPRRTMVLFFVIDTSGSMYGEKIGIVNNTIESVLPEIKEKSEVNADAEIKIAVLNFSTGASWMYNEPISVENFQWDYVDASGLTSLGIACDMLNEKLSRNEFMSDATGSFAPAIFLMSDGEPTDDYAKSLAKLKENNWFKKAIKVALAIGSDANQSILAEFTGSKEAVVAAYTPEELKHWIQFVSIRASEIGSRSANVTGDEKETKQSQFIKELTAEAADANDWDSFDNDNEKW